MHTTFGTRLRAHRERRHVELAAISERTKIKLSLLEDLERDDLSRWPGGVFRRAYVRAYAEAIGLNPDSIVREFLTLYPDPHASADEQLGRAAERRGRPPTRIHFLIESAVSGLFGDRTEGPASEPPGATIPDSASVRQKPESVLREHDLSALAELCTRAARAQRDDWPAVLRDAARLLDAAAFSLWIWDADSTELHPVLTYGYSREVVERLPAVAGDADNALAAAFRSNGRCVVSGSNVATGAVVVPLQTRDGCVGVFAVEFRNGGEHGDCERAIIAILAAQLSSVVGTVLPANGSPRRGEADLLRLPDGNRHDAGAHS